MPSNIIQTVFVHEYGHAIFTQLMKSRGFDYDRKIQEIQNLLNARFVEALQKVDKQEQGKQSDIGLVVESINAYLADPRNPNNLIAKKKKIRNLVSPYSELFADVVDALALGGLAVHTDPFHMLLRQILREIY